MGPTHEHKHNPYTVVGILDRSGSPSDRAIFCSLESVWKAHEHHDEDGEHGDEEGDHEDHQQVAMHDESGDHEGHEHGQHELETTAVLVKLHSPALRRAFKDRVNEQYNAMAAVPVNEIRKLYDQFLGTVKAVLLAIGYLVVVISSISILIGLYMSILQRKRDLAVMRALGASRGEIFGSVLIEGFWVSVLGLGVGWLFGTVTCALLGRYLVAKVGFQISSVSFTPDLVTAYSFVVLMGIVAGLLPAWQAYRSNVARDLAEL